MCENDKSTTRVAAGSLNPDGRRFLFQVLAFIPRLSPFLVLLYFFLLSLHKKKTISWLGQAHACAVCVGRTKGDGSLSTKTGRNGEMAGHTGIYGRGMSVSGRSRVTGSAGIADAVGIVAFGFPFLVIDARI